MSKPSYRSLRDIVLKRAVELQPLEEIMWENRRVSVGDVEYGFLDPYGHTMVRVEIDEIPVSLRVDALIVMAPKR